MQRRKDEIFKNKKCTGKVRKEVVLSIAVVMLLILPAFFVSIQFASAKDMSWAFISVVPKVAKVNTTVLITGWTTPLGVNATTAFKTGYVVTITKPDGSMVNKSIAKSYEDSTFYSSYLVDQTGNWSVKLYWPGDSDFNACTSPPYTFTVVQNVPDTSLPDIPIPTDYWTRPVYADIRGMSLYLGSWPQSDYDGGNRRYNPDSYAPNSAHILWAIPASPSGLLGGEFGDRGGPDPYGAGLTNGIPVLMGKAYFTNLGLTRCIDMSTGNIDWEKQFNGSLTFGFLPEANRVNDGSVFDTRGINPVIFVDRPNGVSGRVEIYNAFDAQPFSNTWIGGGSTVIDSRVGITRYHEGFIYYISGGYLTKWDPCIVGSNLNASSSFATITYQPKLVYRVAIPTGVPNPSMFDGDIAVSNGCTAAFNLTTGQVMYKGKNYVITADGANVSRTYGNLWEGDNTIAFGIYTDSFQGDMRNYGFNITTGELAWYTEPRSYPYGTFNSYSNGAGDGKFYVLSYDGHVYAYNATTGKTIWKFYSGDSTEKPFGTWPFWTASASADGKVYASTGEHSQTNPRMKGDKLYCINDTTGTEIWSIAGMWGGKSIADSKLLAYDGSDGKLYCFGKGPTAVTVSVPESIAFKGNPVLIKGTVTDQSSGQEGTPAVSEASMSAWMEYLHMDRPKPTNATFVEVTLVATDSKGNSQNIGKATTDEFGNYATSWTPPTTGTYTIKASFAGSISYFGSQAGTVLVVSEASSTAPVVTSSPNPTSAPTSAASTPTPTTELTPTTTKSPNPLPGVESATGIEIYIAIAGVIIIIAVVTAALLLRRRK